MKVSSSCFVATLVGLLWFVAAPGVAQEPAAGTVPEEASDVSPDAPVTEDSRDQGFGSTVTVTATRNERSLQETAGGVAVITQEDLARELSSSVEDLVRYEPGVEVAQDPTRLGAGGFIIRGMGGNRVLTRIDGVPVAESFGFGPLGTFQYSLDPQAIDRLEIVKSAGSALYGSDALGGVVALQTRDPLSFLTESGSSPYIGLDLGWDGRRSEARESGAVAFGDERLSGSLFVARRDGSEIDNQGTVRTPDARRTAPNPQDRDATNILGKLVWGFSDRASLKLAVERFDASATTEVYSSRSLQDFGPIFGPGSVYTIATSNFDAVDEEERDRVSLEYHHTVATPLFDVLTARAWTVSSEALQLTDEERVTTMGFGGPPTVTALRLAGSFGFDQDNVGTELQFVRAWGREGGTSHVLTYGLSYAQDRFDMIRDRIARDPATGQVVQEEGLFYPTKYFPESSVDETAVFLQDEISLASGRLRLIPGVRWDRTHLDPERQDRIYEEGNPGIPPPAELDDSAVSPRLGVVWAATQDLSLFVQYARGFRAPPYSQVNNGFSNVAHGYTTLPNPNLEPETSDNYELGLRRSGRRVDTSLVVFSNRYEDFIDTATLGVDPETGLLLYQPQNVQAVSIDGVELAFRARLPHDLQLRSALAWIEGEDDTTGQPLNSVSPPSAVLGLGWQPAGGRFSTEIVATVVDAKDAGDVDRSVVEQFAAPGYELLDLTASYAFSERFTLRAGVFNLLDETYWTWPVANGLSQTSLLLDRYTNPGRNFAASLQLRW